MPDVFSEKTENHVKIKRFDTTNPAISKLKPVHFHAKVEFFSTHGYPALKGVFIILIQDDAGESSQWNRNLLRKTIKANALRCSCGKISCAALLMQALQRRR